MKYNVLKRQAELKMNGANNHKINNILGIINMNLQIGNLEQVEKGCKKLREYDIYCNYEDLELE